MRQFICSETRTEEKGKSVLSNERLTKLAGATTPPPHPSSPPPAHPAQAVKCNQHSTVVSFHYFDDDIRAAAITDDR